MCQRTKHWHTRVPEGNTSAHKLVLEGNTEGNANDHTGVLEGNTLALTVPESNTSAHMLEVANTCAGEQHKDPLVKLYVIHWHAVVLITESESLS